MKDERLFKSYKGGEGPGSSPVVSGHQQWSATCSDKSCWQQADGSSHLSSGEPALLTRHLPFRLLAEVATTRFPKPPPAATAPRGRTPERASKLRDWTQEAEGQQTHQESCRTGHGKHKINQEKSWSEESEEQISNPAPKDHRGQQIFSSGRKEVGRSHSGTVLCWIRCL